MLLMLDAVGFLKNDSFCAKVEGILNVMEAESTVHNTHNSGFSTHATACANILIIDYHVHVNICN